MPTPGFVKASHIPNETPSADTPPIQKIEATEAKNKDTKTSRGRG